MHTLEDLNLTERFIHHLLQNYNKPCFALKPFTLKVKLSFCTYYYFFMNTKLKIKHLFVTVDQHKAHLLNNLLVKLLTPNF